MLHTMDINMESIAASRDEINNSLLLCNKFATVFCFWLFSLCDGLDDNVPYLESLSLEDLFSLLSIPPMARRQEEEERTSQFKAEALRNEIWFIFHLYTSWYGYAFVRFKISYQGAVNAHSVNILFCNL